MMNHYMKSWKITVRKPNLKVEEITLRNCSKLQAIEDIVKFRKLDLIDIVEI